jgi:hypothetical protein
MVRFRSKSLRKVLEKVDTFKMYQPHRPARNDHSGAEPGAAGFAEPFQNEFSLNTMVNSFE